MAPHSAPHHGHATAAGVNRSAHPFGASNPHRYSGLSARVNRSCVEATADEIHALPKSGADGEDSSPSRTIWIWWAQGWSASPELPKLVNACATSWVRSNPDWRVRRLSRADLLLPTAGRGRDALLPGLNASLMNYTVLPSVNHFAFSDILRTELLGLYGGAPTVPCTYLLSVAPHTMVGPSCAVISSSHARRSVACCMRLRVVGGRDGLLREADCGMDPTERSQRRPARRRGEACWA